jgi:Xaa-Pro dipeptidase
VNTPLSRLQSWLDLIPYDAVVLKRPQNVGWITRGSNTPIDRSSPIDPVWLVITAHTAIVVTTTIEAARVQEELHIPGSSDYTIVQVPWYGSDYHLVILGVLSELFANVGREIIVAADDDVEGHDVSDDLIALRMVLDDSEQASLIALGAHATTALEEALAQWEPGDTDFMVQAEVLRNLETTGIQAPIIIVGGDERLERFRHPLAVGAPMNHRVVAVIVARLHGLHVAVTRYAASTPDSARLAADMETVRAIESATLQSLKPGQTYGQTLKTLANAYSAAGHANAWTEHYQGGPIGFDQREFEIAPTDVGSRWFSHTVEVGHAVAFNPSLTGGAKVEDTYLITASGPLLITKSRSIGVTATASNQK